MSETAADLSAHLRETALALVEESARTKGAVSKQFQALAKVLSVELGQAAARIEALERERDKARSTATDRRYMLDAYRSMLSDTGEKVAARWEADGLLRVHFDWTADAATLTGEERAKIILEMEDAPKTRIQSFDDEATAP